MSHTALIHSHQLFQGLLQSLRVGVESSWSFSAEQRLHVGEEFDGVVSATRQLISAGEYEDALDFFLECVLDVERLAQAGNEHPYSQDLKDLTWECFGKLLVILGDFSNTCQTSEIGRLMVKKAASTLDLLKKLIVGRRTLAADGNFLAFLRLNIGGAPIDFFAAVGAWKQCPTPQQRRTIVDTFLTPVGDSYIGPTEAAQGLDMEAEMSIYDFDAIVEEACLDKAHQLFPDYLASQFYAAANTEAHSFSDEAFLEFVDECDNTEKPWIEMGQRNGCMRWYQPLTATMDALSIKSFALCSSEPKKVMEFVRNPDNIQRYDGMLKATKLHRYSDDFHVCHYVAVHKGMKTRDFIVGHLAKEVVIDGRTVYGVVSRSLEWDGAPDAGPKVIRGQILMSGWLVKASVLPGLCEVTYVNRVQASGRLPKSVSHSLMKKRSSDILAKVVEACSRSTSNSGSGSDSPSPRGSLTVKGLRSPRKLQREASSGRASPRRGWSAVSPLPPVSPAGSPPGSPQASRSPRRGFRDSLANLKLHLSCDSLSSSPADQERKAARKSPRKPRSPRRVRGSTLSSSAAPAENQAIVSESMLLEYHAMRELLGRLARGELTEADRLDIRAYANPEGESDAEQQRSRDAANSLPL